MTVERRRDLPLVDVVRLQQQACARAGSDLYGRILDAVTADVAGRGVCAEILEPWARNALADAIPLRFLASVHRIVLSGRAPDLAAAFPSAGGTADVDPVPAFFDTVAVHRSEIESEMGLGVQTNEVGRSATLVGGFHEVARRHRLPLRLLEVGASAGLLQRWDRYRYTADGVDWGADEGVCFDRPWTSAPPPLVDDIEISSRAGCDIAPIDVTTDAGVVALRGFLWPDQVERRARLDAAIDIARRNPVRLDAADAGDWIAAALAEPNPGVATVVYHSIVLQYLPRESFARMRNAIERAGARATADAPVCWLRMEPAGDVADLRLRTWPGGDEQVLATSGFHGPPVTWLAQPPG